MFNFLKTTEDELDKLISHFTETRDKLFALAQKEKEEATKLQAEVTAKIERSARATTIASKLHEIVN